MLEDRAARTNARRAQGQRFAPLLPLLAVKFLQRCAGLPLLFNLARLCRIWSRRAPDRSLSLGCSMSGAVRPPVAAIGRVFRKHNRSPERSICGDGWSFSIHSIMICTSRNAPSRWNSALAGLLHRLPLAIRIHCDHAVGHRSAAPQRHPQIVHRIGAEVGSHVLALLQHTRHPVAQSRGFGRGLQVLVAENAAAFREYSTEYAASAVVHIGRRLPSAAVLEIAKLIDLPRQESTPGPPRYGRNS